MASVAGAETLLYTNGDTTYEQVYFGYGGASKENLSVLPAGCVNPVTGLPDPTLRPDGTGIPEPATMALLGGGLGIMLALRRRNRSSLASSRGTQSL